MKLKSRQLAWMFRLVKLVFACALLIASITPSWALAQSGDDPWAEPLNLSHSGVAMNPAIVTDSEGVVHVVWQDDQGNFVYTRSDGDQWTAPETTDLNRRFEMPIPIESTDQSRIDTYTDPNLRFIAGPGREIFAFWISPQGRLFRSKVQNSNFEDFVAWDSGRLISPKAVSFAAAVDARGELHLAYIRTIGDAANPAGVYYTRSKNNGSYWSVPVLLYESSYLRSLDGEKANISLSTAGTEDALRVFVAWDNRPRKQVFLAQSTDGGETWEEPVLVAGPVPASGSTDPFNIQVGADQNSVVLVWQSGSATNGLLPACSRIYQSSRDAGATWSDPQPMNEDPSGCAQSNEFVRGLANSPEDPLYLLSKTKNQVSLTAWNGIQWSQPQVQPILSGFEEPEIYSEVIYGCHQASLSGKRLYIVGCDQGEGGDIWFTSRDLGSNTSWFKPPIWSQLAPVTSENLEMEVVELVTTVDDLIHAFVGQHQNPAIYYTYWDGESWSRITPVFELPDGEAGQPAVAAGHGNELFLIAPNNRGALYFSRATSGNAATESRWSTPARLGIEHDGEIGSADVAWDAAGTIFVAYSVPVNEERGIYLVMSKDQGTTWSEPLQVFDGAAAGFDLIGAPSLLTSANGLMHVIWKVQSVQGDGVSQPLSLYFARSENGGKTFNDAEPVVEEPVAWQEIMIDDKGNLHLLWQSQGAPTAVWDQVSMDGGRSWQHPQGLPGEGRLSAVTRDPSGRLHLVGVGPSALSHWLWDGSRWQSETPLGWPLFSQQASPVELLSAVVNKQGEMMVVLAEPTGEGNAAERTLLYSTRMLELPPDQAATQMLPTPTLLPRTSTQATLTSEPPPAVTTTAASKPTDPPEQTNRNETSNRTSPFTIALFPVALLLLIVMGIVIRRVTRGEDR